MADGKDEMEPDAVIVTHGSQQYKMRCLFHEMCTRSDKDGKDGAAKLMK